MLQGYQGSLLPEVEPYFLSNAPEPAPQFTPKSGDRVELLLWVGGRDVSIEATATGFNPGDFVEVTYRDRDQPRQFLCPQKRILQVIPNYPLEHAEEDDPHDPIAQLEQCRRHLLSQGVAPAGCWLEKAKCHKRKVYQVFYRAEQPIFGGRKRLYVGMEGSLAVRDAEAAIARRNELKRIDRLLQRLERSD